MAGSTSELSPAELMALLPTIFAALNRTRMLSIASLCWFVYDYALTFDGEIEFFWSGKWTVTRILFFVNRYFPPIILAFAQVCLFWPSLSYEFCTHAIPGIFLSSAIAITVVQLVLVIRCWYLFQNSLFLRIFILAAFIGCGSTTFIFIGLMWKDMKPLPIEIPGLVWDGCMAPITPGIWRVFTPGVVIHTILYGATTIPALKLKTQGKSSPIMNRLLRDGGAMYLVVFSTVMFSGIGALSKNLSISTPATYSNFLLSATSIAVSRLILSMHSLAANLSLDPKWLLNNAELSRVQWRKGSRDGEIIVEVNPAEPELELGAVVSAAKAQLSEEERRGERGARRNMDCGITETKYGFYEDLSMPTMMYSGETRP